MNYKIVFHTIIVLFISITFACNAKQNDKNEIDDSEKIVIKNGDARLDYYLPYLQNKRVALVVNHTSSINGVLLSDTLMQRGINVVKLFTPEHGYTGNYDAGARVGNSQTNNIEIISLYGKNKKPTIENMRGIDVVVYDLQDVGVRFYTYISTMHYVMEACAETDIPFVVLDRPNPNGDYIAGPILEPDCKSFVGMHPIPIVYGLTAGELACMINAEGWLAEGRKCDLKVVRVEGYNHSMRLPLEIFPSPNLKSDLAIRLYPSLCLLEGSTVSVGRGTNMPFTIVGAPDSTLGSFKFIPKSIEGAKTPMHQDIQCYGDDLRNAPDSSHFTLDYLMKYFNHMKDKFWGNVKMFDLLAGTKSLRQQLNEGLTADSIISTWEKPLKKYDALRHKYFLYDIANKCTNTYDTISWPQDTFTPQIDTLLQKMTMDEKIAQLIWITLNDGESILESEKVLHQIEQYNPGGLLILHSTPQLTSKFIEKANAKTKLPLLFAADAENGLAMKYDNVVKLPKNMSLGAIRDTMLLETTGEYIAKQMKMCGFNVNFAPVVDVNTNSKNPIIGIRSFGENPNRVARCANAYIRGLQRYGVAAVIKHFPGHGDTSLDSHKALPQITADQSRLDTIELKPFQSCINQNVIGVMCAHISVPKIDNINKSASLSPILLRDMLRNKMEFKGLIITDAINMAGIQIAVNKENAEAAAIAAGNDVAEFSTNIEAAIQAVKSKLEKGEIDTTQLEQSVRRVIATKLWASSNNSELCSYPEMFINNIDAELLSDKLYLSSITTLKNKNLEKICTTEITYFGDWQHNFTAKNDTIDGQTTELIFVDDKNIQAYNKYIDLKQISNTTNYAVFYAGNPYRLSQLHTSTATSLSIVYENNKQAKNAIEKFAFYGGTANGVLPVSVGIFKEGEGKTTIRK